MISENDAFNKLKNTNHNLIDNSFNDFAQKLYEFLFSIQQNQEIYEQLNNKAQFEEKSAKAFLNDQESNLLQKLKCQNKKIKNYYVKCNIELHDSFNKFEFLFQGKIVSSGNLIDSLQQETTRSLDYLLHNFPLNSHLEFVKKFSNVNENGNITASKLIIEIIRYHNEQERLNRLQRSTFWYQWQELMYFYQLYTNYEKLRLDVTLKGQLFNEWQLVDDFKKIKGIAMGQQPEYMNELKNAQQELFELAIKIHTSKQQPTVKIKENLQAKAHDKINYDKKKGLLRIVDKDIPIIKNTAQERFLKLFFPSGKLTKKSFEIEHIHKKCFQSPADLDKEKLVKDDKDQVYALKRELNKKIDFELFVTQESNIRADFSLINLN